MTDHWIFAYGSLIWDPGFSYIDRCRAVLEGYERAFCVYSREYRGTPLRPGLTLGLVRGGRVEGFAYRISPCYWDQTYETLVKREQNTGSYVEKIVPVITANNALIKALVFIAADPGPDLACNNLQEQANIIATCSGTKGSNFDYLKKLMQSLELECIKDENMITIWTAVRAYYKDIM